MNRLAFVLAISTCLAACSKSRDKPAASAAAPAAQNQVPVDSELADDTATLLAQNQVFFVGENHASEGLSRGILELVRDASNRQNLDCLFLELSYDLQTQIDASLEASDLHALSLAVTRSKKEATIYAYQRLGYSQEQLANLKTYMDEHEGDELRFYPFNKALLALLKEKHIHLIAYDAHSQSPEVFNSMYYATADQVLPRSEERDKGNLNAIGVRNLIMSQKIFGRFQNQECHKGIVVIGSGHLMSPSALKQKFADLGTYTSLQDDLKAKNISGQVLIADKLPGETSLGILPGADKAPWYSGYVGTLNIP